MDNTIMENQHIQILSAGVHLDGIVNIPAGAKGFVLFVHGSGSSRNSPRNQFVAQTLQEGGLATVLFDLLTPQEGQIDQQTRQLRFDISLLARRTIGALDWLGLQPYMREFKIGLFGSSTGAAAALIAAAELPETVSAVVSRGGRPDLAGPTLSKVHVPTLLIVGSHDQTIVDLNEETLAQMPLGTEKKLMIVPGASHLFEEPGTLGYAARLARDWFHAHLTHVQIR